MENRRKKKGCIERGEIVGGVYGSPLFMIQLAYANCNWIIICIGRIVNIFSENFITFTKISFCGL